MPMPTFCCPNCNTEVSVETVFAHEGVRDAIKALIGMHPDGERLLGPAVRYVGLFAPAKTKMRFDRIASLLLELQQMMRAGQIHRDSRTWPAPIEYWRRALEEVLARRDAGTLRLPLTSHGLLMVIVIGYSAKAEARAEATVEAQRAGHAGSGTTPDRAVAVTTSAGPARVPMPDHVREQLAQIKGRQGPKGQINDE